MERNRTGMSTNGNIPGPVSDGDEFDWRWVGEPESWMGLRSERAMAHRPSSATAASEPTPGRFANRVAALLRSFLSR
jgi:hypothetical protein